ncbi:hypothetical protein RFI_31359, partial [Reticulomyxa filosa]
VLYFFKKKIFSLKKIKIKKKRIENPWNEANKIAHTIVEQMVKKNQSGIVVVSINLDQLARPNDRWFFQNIPFTMMINSHKYMKEKKVIPPYTVYSFHSKNITFDNIIIDGCVYAIDCVINGIGHFHITQYLIHTRKSVICYTFQQPVFTVSWPIDLNKFMESGMDLCKESNFDEAISLLRFIICVRLQTLDKSDVEVSYAFFWLAEAFLAKKDFDRSIAYNKKALKIILDKLGSDHIDVSKVYCALGIAYNGKGEYDKASDYHQQALEIQLKNVGDSHNDVASSYDSLGRVYCMKAEYDKAYEYHEKALNIYLKQLDENQIDVSLCYCHLGNVLRGKGEYVKSIEYHEKGLNVLLEQFGENHTHSAKSMFWLGMAYFETGEYETSIEYLEQALNIQLLEFGKMQINKAREYANKALTILVNDKSNSFDLEIAKSYDVLGLILEKDENTEKSKNLNDNDLYIGWSFHYLASAFKNKNDLNKSIEFGEKALKLRLNKLDCDHPHVGESYVLLGDIYLARGSKTKAKESYENALKIFNKRFGGQHQKAMHTILILEKINEIIIIIIINKKKDKSMQRWEENDENGKAEIIGKFKRLTRNGFREWLLDQKEWKDDVKSEDIPAIRATIESDIEYDSVMMFCFFNFFFF